VTTLQGHQATDNRDRVRLMPWWRQVCWVVIGLGLDWRCAFDWFAGKSPFYSEIVLGRTVLIVLACAGIALLAVCLTPEAKLQHASPIFFALSFVVYDILSVYWIVHRR
jgi:hypothetical protein